MLVTSSPYHSTLSTCSVYLKRYFNRPTFCRDLALTGGECTNKFETFRSPLFLAVSYGNGNRIKCKYEIMLNNVKGNIFHQLEKYPKKNY